MHGDSALFSWYSNGNNAGMSARDFPAFPEKPFAQFGKVANIGVVGSERVSYNRKERAVSS